MNRGQDVLKQRGLFITNDGEAASQPAGQKGSGASEVERSDDAAETTGHFIRFKGDRLRIKTALEYDTGSRPHTSRCSPWGSTVSIAI